MNIQHMVEMAITKNLIEWLSTEGYEVAVLESGETIENFRPGQYPGDVLSTIRDIDPVEVVLTFRAGKSKVNGRNWVKLVYGNDNGGLNVISDWSTAVAKFNTAVRRVFESTENENSWTIKMNGVVG